MWMKRKEKLGVWAEMGNKRETQHETQGTVPPFLSVGRNGRTVPMFRVPFDLEDGAGGEDLESITYVLSPWVREMLNKPEIIGRSVGFRDLTEMHGDWIYEMVYGEEDYTLQAHRGS